MQRPCNKQHFASLPCSGLATKLMNNDARLSNNKRARSKEILDIRNMTNRWKTMFDEFFARPDNSPPIADPPQPEIPTPEITYKGVGAAVFLKPYQRSSKAAARGRAIWRRGKRCHMSNGGPRPARSGLTAPPGGGTTSEGAASRRAADI